MARSCIYWFTVASAGSQRICWFIGHLMVHICIWWFTGAPAPADPHSCIWRLIVASADSLLNLMVHCCICSLSVAFSLIHRCSPLRGSLLHQAIHSCADPQFHLLVCSSIHWFTVASHMQLHLQLRVHSCIGWFRVAPAHAQWHAACWFTGSCGGLHLHLTVCSCI
jgi:hypothetical protein